MKLSEAIEKADTVVKTAVSKKIASLLHEIAVAELKDELVRIKKAEKEEGK